MFIANIISFDWSSSGAAF